MASPGIIGGIGVGSSLIGSLVSAFGSAYQGQALSNMYTYQAGIAKMNQQIATQNANYDVQAGEVEAQGSGLQTAFQVGQTKVGEAAGNINPNTGSPNRVVSSEIEVGQENQAVLRANAAKQAYGESVAATTAGASATLATMGAETSSTAGTIGAISSLVSGAGSVSSKWLQGNQMGLWNNLGGGQPSSSA